MSQTTVEMWAKALSWVFDMLKQQGISFGLLAIAVWFLNTKLERVETDNKKCNNKMIEMYESISIANQKVIEKNTFVLEAIEKRLK